MTMVHLHVAQLLFAGGLLLAAHGALLLRRPIAVSVGIVRSSCCRW
jgi:hypothetical protein